MICKIRFFLLYLAKNIFGNITSHLSLFELSRCKTMMCFATETKLEKKTQLILLCFILNLKRFSFNKNHMGIPLTCFIAGHNLTSAIIIQAIWFLLEWDKDPPNVSVNSMHNHPRQPMQGPILLDQNFCLEGSGAGI